MERWRPGVRTEAQVRGQECQGEATMQTRKWGTGKKTYAQGRGQEHSREDGVPGKRTKVRWEGRGTRWGGSTLVGLEGGTGGRRWVSGRRPPPGWLPVFLAHVKNMFGLTKVMRTSKNKKCKKCIVF